MELIRFGGFNKHLHMHFCQNWKNVFAYCLQVWNKTDGKYWTQALCLLFDRLILSLHEIFPKKCCSQWTTCIQSWSLNLKWWSCASAPWFGITSACCRFNSDFYFFVLCSTNISTRACACVRVTWKNCVDFEETQFSSLRESEEMLWVMMVKKSLCLRARAATFSGWQELVQQFGCCSFDPQRNFSPVTWKFELDGC